MRVFFVDDDANLRKVLGREIEAFGYTVDSFRTAEEALEALSSTRPDVVLVDLRLPGIDGQALLEVLKEREPMLPVLLLTGHGGVPEAVRAMRSGAYDFLTKPVSLDTLEQTLRRARVHAELLRENQRLRELVSQGAIAGTILGTSEGARNLRHLIERVATADENVLITGENGTGKELVARSVHEHSGRAPHPFVIVNCGAIPESLVESELFGHERGAFTGADRRRVGLFEAAHRGTLFLDEIGELPLAVQPKLLRAVQDGELRRVGGTRSESVDVRVVAATNRDLHEEVAHGNFREDLYYRISTLLIEVPPLRERREDIELLALSFLERAGGSAPQLSPEALERMRTHEWPGNVRELQNAVARLAALVEAPTIEPEDIERYVFHQRRRPAGALPTLDLEELEREAIVQALRLHAGNRKRVAGELGVAIKTLYNKIQRYGIDPERVVSSS